MSLPEFEFFFIISTKLKEVWRCAKPKHQISAPRFLILIQFDCVIISYRRSKYRNTSSACIIWVGKLETEIVQLGQFLQTVHLWNWNWNCLLCTFKNNCLVNFFDLFMKIVHINKNIVYLYRGRVVQVSVQLYIFTIKICSTQINLVNKRISSVHLAYFFIFFIFRIRRSTCKYCRWSQCCYRVVNYSIGCPVHWQINADIVQLL